MPPLPIQGLLPPLPPPPSPQSQARPPRTCAKGHRRVRGRRDGNTAAPPSVAGGRRGGQGGGRKGLGERRVKGLPRPARKAQPLGHPGTAAATAGMRPGQAPSPRPGPLKKILESPSDSKEIKPVNPKGNQP